MVKAVLLYYCYADLGQCRDDVYRWLKSNCEHLGLRGRARVAFDGINVTVGGDKAQLDSHISAVDSHPLFSKKIDFKLAVSEGPSCDAAVKESHFDGLSVTLCQEVVSLGGPVVHPAELASAAAPHVTPANFHQLLEAAQLGESEKEVVLLDTRNIYETRIGHFLVEGVRTLDPKIRQFSDLRSWMDTHGAELADRKVLMYCTGGVRCERASAYLRSKGPGFQDVLQLQGGIQRYLEAGFPNGGYFAGTNFVFDERGGVPGGGQEVGSCLLCASPCSSYNARLRCSICRILTLLSPRGRPLRILCLHGFRQSAKKFRGQLSAFTQKLRGVAEFTFIDAPHLLPYLYKASPPSNGLEETSKPADAAEFKEACQPAVAEDSKADMSEAAALPADLPNAGAPRRAWLVCPEQLGYGLKTEGSGWEEAPHALDETQYLRQVCGWEESWKIIQEALTSKGPFDGILGFSQGCGVAAAVCALQQKEIEASAKLRSGADQSPPLPWHPLRFAILCSGYPSPVAEHKRLLEEIGQIRMPSFHTIGSETLDRQISPNEGLRLAEWFCVEGCHVVRHRGGHTIPVSRGTMDQCRAFLAAFSS